MVSSRTEGLCVDEPRRLADIAGGDVRPPRERGVRPRQRRGAHDLSGRQPETLGDAGHVGGAGLVAKRAAPLHAALAGSRHVERQRDGPFGCRPAHPARSADGDADGFLEPRRPTQLDALSRRRIAGQHGHRVQARGQKRHMPPAILIGAAVRAIRAGHLEHAATRGPRDRAEQRAPAVVQGAAHDHRARLP
jgi:hypothetical protein